VSDEYEELEQALRAWVVQIMRLSIKSFMEFATRTGLSLSQIAVLFRLNGDKHCAVTNLGEELGISSAAASQMVEKLVQLGLLERIEDPNDRRIKRLLLTQSGKSIIEKSIKRARSGLLNFVGLFRQKSLLVLLIFLMSL